MSLFIAITTLLVFQPYHKTLAFSPHSLDVCRHHHHQHQSYTPTISQSSTALSAKRGGGKKPKFNEFGHDYNRVGGPINSAICNLKEDAIHKLIRKRMQYKFAREYQQADATFAELKKNGIIVDDKNKLWRFSFRGPDMSNCKTIEEASQLAYQHLGSMSPRDMSAFWSIVSRILQKDSHANENEKQRSYPPNLKNQLNTIFTHTMTNIGTFKQRDLAQTAMAFAKISNSINTRNAKHGEKGSPGDIFGSIMIKEQELTFQSIANAAYATLDEADARCLSNFAYAYALVGIVPHIDGDDGKTLFDHIADKSISLLYTFNPQNLSNILWAFARAGVSHDRLFQEVGHDIVVSHNLQQFKPQGLSNIVYAYAKVEQTHKDLFQAVADHIASLANLEAFNQQTVANIIWAYAKTGAHHPDLFEKFANHILEPGRLALFKPQGLANTLWAYAKAGVYHPHLFDQLVDEVLKSNNLQSYKPQELSSILWGLAKAGVSHTAFFDKAGDHIAGGADLDCYTPQDLSNIMWSFAKTGEFHRPLFQKIADFIVSSEDIGAYNPQTLSMILWSFATLGVLEQRLFAIVADQVALQEHLQAFNPQDLSNIVWAHAASEIADPRLFDQIATHIVGLENLDDFTPQALSNILWGYTVLQESYPLLSEKITNAAIEKKEAFNFQEISSLLWVQATAGIVDEHVYLSMVPVVRSIITTCNEQCLANIAWAYTVSGVAAPSLFDDEFIKACLAKEDEFTTSHLSQLYQWEMWQEELSSNVHLPESLIERCRSAFISQGCLPSTTQDEVISELGHIGLDPKEEYQTPRGYFLDALVEVNGSKIGIEVDGPSHYIGEEPTGSTFLKQRQVSNLDGISVVSVPYWEWDEHGDDSSKKQQYLRSLLRSN